MNESAEKHPLIIGIGNPLRSDDGLGWAVAAQMSREGCIDCDIQVVHQLTPELVNSVVMASLVIIIDASSEGVPGELRTYPLSPSHPPGIVGSHFTTPEELVALTEGVYGHCPPVVVVTMTGADFSIGEQLSPIVADEITRVCAAVGQIIYDLTPGHDKTLRSLHSLDTMIERDTH